MATNDLRIAAAIVEAPLGRYAHNFAKAADYTRRARAEGARLVCFPEMNLSGYSTREIIRDQAQSIDSPLIEKLEDLADATRMVILAGLAEAAPDGRLFASHLVVAPKRKAAVLRRPFPRAVHPHGSGRRRSHLLSARLAARNPSGQTRLLAPAFTGPGFRQRCLRGGLQPGGNEC